MQIAQRTATLLRRLRLGGGRAPVPAFEHVPAPPSERGHWLLAGATAALGLTALLVALSGVLASAPQVPVAAPPPVLLRAVTPPPAHAPSAVGTRARGAPPAAAILGHSPAAGAPGGLEDALQEPVPARWLAGFYPIYTVAQDTFGVNWLLLASIHQQESAFSTAPGTYRGLNFARCCGGPMQFNVTNGKAGIPSTWDLVKDSYRYGPRPAGYDHPTARHPSIYDDFDAIMAAAHLLSADGAALALDQSAWGAAYDYYGHDAAGVTYADQVLARAIGWSQHGFCAGCQTEPGLLAAVHAAYGAPVLAALEAAASPPAATRPRPPGRSARRPPGR